MGEDGEGPPGSKKFLGIFNKAQVAFLKWNFGPFLLLVHLANLFPFALLDFYLEWRPLVFADLYCAFALMTVYAIWYLTVLDGWLKLHFYIIFCPRRWWSVIFMAGLLWFEVVIFTKFAHEVEAKPVHDALGEWRTTIRSYWISLHYKYWPTGNR